MTRRLLVRLCLLVVLVALSRGIESEVVEEYRQWLQEHSVHFHHSTLDPQGQLITTEPIQSRTILMTASHDALLGWVPEYPADYQFHEPSEHTRLIHEFLHCLLQSDGHRPFCVYLKEIIQERLAESDPALLWPDEDRQILTGSFMEDRIQADREWIKSVQEQYPQGDLTMEDVLVAIFAAEVLSVKIVHAGQYQLVLVPVYASLPLKGSPKVAPIGDSDDAPRTTVGFDETSGTLRLWVDDVHEKNEEVSAAWMSMKAWRKLEIVGLFDPLDLFQDNSVPLDVYLRGYDKQYDAKMQYLKEHDFLAPQGYPLNEAYYHVEHRGLLSQPLMALLRIKHLTGKISPSLDLTEPLNPNNERLVYAEITNLLSSKLQDDYPTTLVQDTRQFERRQVLENSRRYRGLGILIKEKSLLEGALRSAQFLAERTFQPKSEAKDQGKKAKESFRKHTQKMKDLPL